MPLGAWTPKRNGLTGPTSRFGRSPGSTTTRLRGGRASLIPKKTTVPEQLSNDRMELLDALNRRKAQYLVIGAHAVGIYTEPRGTKDLDIWINPTKTNAQRVYAALKKFGAPSSARTRRR